MIRRTAFERAGLARAWFDERLGLTDEEFRVEGGLICIGPVHEDAALADVVAELEAMGLAYYDEVFEMSGSWPSWLALFAMEARLARND